jgi:undecaprenyl-diphosphatase
MGETAPVAESPIEWRRHPADLARFLVAGALLLVILGLAWWQPDALTTFSSDIVGLLGHLPEVVRDVLGGVAQLAVFILPLAAIAWGIRARALRPVLITAVCAVAAALADGALNGWLDRVAPPQPTGFAHGDSWLFGADFPSSAYVAALAAGVTVLAPLLNRSWRRVAWGGVFVAAFLRLLTTEVVPVNVGVAVALGVATASAVLLAAGAPWRRTSPARVAAALAAAGVDVDEVQPVERGSRPSFSARDDDGRPLHVAWIGRDERDADLLYRTWRSVRVKGVDDELAGLAARQQVREEALALVLAAEAGARVPTVVAVGDTDDGDGLLAVEELDGRRLDELGDGEVGEDLLDALWVDVRSLRSRRIAHRRLGADQVLVTADGPVLLGLRAAQLSASDVQLDLDVANLLVATAALVGPERAVAAARRTLADDDLTAALGFLQPLALTSVNRRLIKADKSLLKGTSTALQEATGVEEVSLFPLERIGWSQILGVVGTGVLVVIVVALAANWSDIADALGQADWSRLPLLVVLAMLPYVTGAMSLMGSVIRRLPLGRTTLVMFAQSFLNRFTPMNAGGMAMRVRYLQKGGTDVTVAAAAVGLTSAASGVAQGVMIAVFALWAGTSPGGSFSLPDIEHWPLLVLVIAALFASVWFVPSLRRLAARWLKPLKEKLVHEAGELLHRPDKLGMLFGGAFLGKVLNILAFVVSCRALGITLGFPELGALYMFGNTVGSTVPTPGGVGAIGAALAAALTGAGVDPATASAAVIVFRLATYWLPVLPGWLCLVRARKLDLV